MHGLGAQPIAFDYYGTQVPVGGAFFSSAQGQSTLPGVAGNYFSAASLAGNPWNLNTFSPISDAQYAVLVQGGAVPLSGGALTAAQAGAASTAAAATAAATASASATSWFTDPTQELIAGVPNMYLAAGAGLVVLLLMMKKK